MQIGLLRTYGSAFFFLLHLSTTAVFSTGGYLGYEQKPTPGPALLGLLNHSPASLSSGLPRHALGPKESGEATGQI